MKEPHLMKNFPMAEWRFLQGFIAGFLIVLFTLISQPSIGQIRQTWFDINPSSSNTDNNNPNGSSGGRINHMGSTSTLSRIYAASEWGGLYTSFNQGLTWVKVNSFNPSATWDVKVDPRNGEKIYVTSFYDGRVNGRFRTSRSGISISSNAGATWTNAPLPPGPCAVAARQNEPSAWEISINPTNTQMVFVGTNCGLARTFDGGTTWTYVDPSPGSAEQ
ncbi:MAG: WD40/YVTN/BNR-like repeat-containing protein, partial [Flavitalea sp.]